VVHGPAVSGGQENPRQGIEGARGGCYNRDSVKGGVAHSLLVLEGERRPYSCSHFRTHPMTPRRQPSGPDGRMRRVSLREAPRILTDASGAGRCPVSQRGGDDTHRKRSSWFLRGGVAPDPAPPCPAGRRPLAGTRASL